MNLQSNKNMVDTKDTKLCFSFVFPTDAKCVLASP